MRWSGGRRGGNIEDRRGMGGGVALGGGGLGVVAILLIGYFTGIDPSLLMNIAGGGGMVETQPGTVGTPTDEEAQFVDTILTSTTDVWTVLFQQEGRTYQQPDRLVIYDQATGTGCGTGQSAMGPFYCPLDRKIYLDLDFFRELSDRFGAPGDFARAYVIGHEVGHHVQQLLGISDQVRQRQEAARSEADANAWSVRLELQADCYAGVWAAHAAAVSGGQVALEPGDIEEGLRAAQAIGDDTLQKATRGRVVPDSFTHGSSADRQMWLKRGLDRGNADACDTFAD